MIALLLAMVPAFALAFALFRGRYPGAVLIERLRRRAPERARRPSPSQASAPRVPVLKRRGSIASRLAGRAPPVRPDPKTHRFTL